MTARARFFAAGLAAVWLCSGCISLRHTVVVRDAQIAAYREDVARMKAALERADAELKEKDAVIKELKEKLRNFGVF